MNKTRVLNAVDRFRDYDSAKKRWSPLGLFLTIAVASGIIVYTIIVVKRYVEVPSVSSYSESIEGKRFPATFICQSQACHLQSAYGPQAPDCQDVAFTSTALTKGESIDVELCYSVDPIDGILATWSNTTANGNMVVFGLTMVGSRLVLDSQASNYLEEQSTVAYIKEGTTFLQIIHYWNQITGDEGDAYYPVTIIEDSSVYNEQYGASSLPPNTSFSHIAPWLVYTSIKVSRTSVLSLVGEIGGFLDLLVQAAVTVLIVTKCVLPKNDNEERHKAEMNEFT